MLISMVESFMAKLFTLGIEPDRVDVMETIADVIRDVLHVRD